MKTLKPPYLGFDLGASSGRAVLGFLEKNKFRIEEIHRFTNGPVPLGNTLYWNFLGLWSNITESLQVCSRRGLKDLSGIGVDTWGVDFGLLDSQGRLLSNPVYYRDSRTEGIEKVIAKKLSDESIYRLTGLRIGRVSTLSQLVAMRRDGGRGAFEPAKTLLMMSDLLRYWLCGDKSCELTAVGSSALTDVHSQKWSSKLFKTFDLPRKIMPTIVPPGRVVGNLLPEIHKQMGKRSVPVIAVAGHDTASAAAAVPFADDETAFASCGTWAVVGTIEHKPITTSQAFEKVFVNEFGSDSILVVKNLAGLYLFENLLRAELKGGAKLNYSQLIRESERARPFPLFFNLNSPALFSTEDPNAAIGAYLRLTKQRIPVGRGSLVRGILEGLAFSFREAIRDSGEITGRRFKRLCIVGGGSRNALLCQMAADTTGLQVVAGPAEATVMGNLGIQALATGALKKPSDIRTLVRNSTALTVYQPRNTPIWEKKFGDYLDIVERSKAILQ